MNPVSALKRTVRDRLGGYVRDEVSSQLRAVLPSVLEFAASEPSERLSAMDHTKDPLRNIEHYRVLRRRLLDAGASVEDRSVDVEDFKAFLAGFPQLEAFYSGLGEVRIEKCLEHYLSYRALGLEAGDTFVDVGASGSPWAAILRSTSVRAYALDLGYPAGVRDWRIGGDACDPPVPDGFADGLAAHCSFECFEGDADIQFIESTSRVLRPGGHCAILPLYLEHEYFIATSPLCDQHGVRIDADAKRVWRDDEYVVPFSRHYSPEAFVARILAAVPSDMSATVVAFSNIDEVMAVFPRQRIYAFFMLGLQKSKAERAVLV